MPQERRNRDTWVNMLPEGTQLAGRDGRVLALQGPNRPVVPNRQTRQCSEGVYFPSGADSPEQLRQLLSDT